MKPSYEEARARLEKWCDALHSDVTPLDGTDRDSPTFGDLRAVFRQAGPRDRATIERELADATDAYRRSKDAMDSSTFNGRGRSSGLYQDIERLRAELSKAQ